MRSTACVVTVSLLLVLLGHLCPLDVALGHAESSGGETVAVPARALDGPGPPRDHHGPHLSTCLPGAVRPAPAVPSIGLDEALVVDAGCSRGHVAPALSRPSRPVLDARHLGPPLHLLDPVLLI